MTERKTPRIRFKGFTEGWKQRKLSDITSLITKGTTPLDKSGEGDINFIKVENLDSSSGEVLSCSKISRTEHEGYLKRSQLKENDILFSIAGTLGRVGLVKSSVLPANTNQALAIIRTKEGDLNYLATVLRGKAVTDFIRRNPTVGAQPNLSLEQVANLEIPYPSLLEQQKIGSFFTSLDKAITLHQREYEKLQIVKKSMLENCFPKNGECVPKIRFSGFTGVWGQRKLGDVINLNGRIGFRGYMRRDIITKEAGGILTFSPSNIVNNNLTLNVKNTYITKAKYDESPEIKIHNGDILFVKTGSTLGKSALVTGLNEPASINPQIVVMRTSEGLAEFLSAQLKSDIIQKQVTADKIGGAVPTMTEAKIKDFDIFIPHDEDEARKIGQYFSQLDNLITLHHRKLEKLKTIKKSLLENMFV